MNIHCRNHASACSTVISGSARRPSLTSLSAAAMSAACTRCLSPDSPCSSTLSELYRPARSSVSLSSACLSSGGNIAVRLLISSCWESVSSSSGSSCTRTSISFHSSLPSGDSFAASPSNNSTSSLLLTASLRTPGHQGGATLYLYCI